MAFELNPDEEVLIDSGYLLVGDDGKPEVVAKDEVLGRVVELQKSVDGSTQSQRELREYSDTLVSMFTKETDLQEPPFDPEQMLDLYIKDTTHYRAVVTKVNDSVGRDLKFQPVQPLSDKDPTDIDCDHFVGTVNEDDYNAQLSAIKCFMEDANPDNGFQQVIKDVATDYEAVGWAAIEVVRGADMRVKHIQRIPATRIRALKGLKGFVEIVDADKEDYIYYQPFGTKVVVEETNPITQETKAVPYSPRHGELSIENPALGWSLLNRQTGEPLSFEDGDVQGFVSAFRQSANEVIWIQKKHPATLYYGYPDVVPAIPAILEKMHISAYSLQYFENNTVPRYAIIVEGAKLDPEIKKMIESYFTQHLKSEKHVTPVIELPAIRGKNVIKLRFERLDADHKESDYLETKKTRSEEIREAHGLPPAVMGNSEQTELGSGKGLSQAEIYKDRVVVPMQKTWERHINKLFAQGLGVNLVKSTFSPLDIRDRFMEMQIVTGLLDRGLIRINEGRNMIEEIEGKIEGGDRAFVRIKEASIKFIDEFDGVTSFGNPDSATADDVMSSLENEQESEPPQNTGENDS